MGPPARPLVRKMGYRHIEKGPLFHIVERYLTMRYATCQRAQHPVCIASEPMHHIGA